MPAEALPRRGDAPRQRAGLGKGLKNREWLGGTTGMVMGDGKIHGSGSKPEQVAGGGHGHSHGAMHKPACGDGRGRIRVRSCEDKRSWRCSMVP